MLESRPVSRAIEERNRRMLRARDAMDSSYAEPLAVAALARQPLTRSATRRTTVVFPTPGTPVRSRTRRISASPRSRSAISIA